MYLGHIIQAKGVAMDQSKVASVLDWPRAQSVRALRGFFGLAGTGASSRTSAPLRLH